MKPNRHPFRPFLLASVIALAGLFTACTQGGLSADEAESLQTELAEVQSRLDDIEAAVSDLQEQELDTAQQEEIANEVAEAVDDARSRLQAMDETLTPPEPATDPALNQPAAPAAPGGATPTPPAPNTSPAMPQ